MSWSSLCYPPSLCAGGPLFSPERIGPSTLFIEQLIEDGKAPPPEGGKWGSNEPVPVPLWPDPDDGGKAEAAKAVPKEKVRPRASLCLHTSFLPITLSLKSCRSYFSARLNG